jgi:hypothetical protein
MRLPKVRMDLLPLSFISRTASTGSCVTSCVFAHDRVPVKVVEKTTFDSPAKAPVPGSPSVASPDMTREVFAPIRTVVRFRLISQPGKYSGPGPPVRPAVSSPYPSVEVMKSMGSASAFPFSE